MKHVDSLIRHCNIGEGRVLKVWSASPEVLQGLSHDWRIVHGEGLDPPSKKNKTVTATDRWSHKDGKYAGVHVKCTYFTYGLETV